MNLSSLLSVKSEFREGAWGKATAKYPTGGSPAGEKFESASSGLDRPVVAAAAGFRLGGRTTAWEQTGTGGRRLLLPGRCDGGQRPHSGLGCKRTMRIRRTLFPAFQCKDQIGRLSHFGNNRMP